MLKVGYEVWAWNNKGINRARGTLIEFRERNHKVLVDNEVCFFDNIQEIKEVEMTTEQVINELEIVLGVKIKIK